ncbi:fungal-specific transcription factor domain-containing protein [Xylariaceae sp. FL0016]|nr:fungal-specific transcription factor domain-containing protein [Xylariaceae sp. FL0016]
MQSGTSLSLKSGPELPTWLQNHFGQEEESVARGKRSRVALACQRCKTRKQKCDGKNPCSKCKDSDVDCEYVIPQRAMPLGKNHYIKQLERRVAELEIILASQGMPEPSSDHWKMPSPGAAASTFSDGAPSDIGSKSNPSLVVDIDDPDEAVREWQNQVDPVVSVLRDLSLDVNGSGYLGASSHLALGRLFNFLGRGRAGHASRRSSRHSVAIPQLDFQTASERPVDFADVPSNVADRLFSGYLKHVATRFPVIYSVWARDIHQRRHSLTDSHEIAVLHLVYATAGRFLETTGELGGFQARRHYASAVELLDTILGLNDVRTIQTLMLMGIYSLRDPIGPGAWTFSRTALLIAIDQGLHRQKRGQTRPNIQHELRKRIFWACYAFDRQISVPMGRPFGISDRDIDVELPLDINEDTTQDQLASLGSIPNASVKSSSLTSFIMVARLRRIESDIQQTIYRVDEFAEVEDAVIDGFLTRLEEWKDMIPEDTKKFKDSDEVPYDGYDYYMVFYYKCQRLLLYPQICRQDVNSRFLKLCAKACAGVCRAYKTLHQSLAVGYSFMALQTVFMAGLTLVYCIWISPNDIFDMTTSSGIHDCSIILFVIAERVHSAKKYRNAFEVIRQQVIDKIAQAPERQPREAVTGLNEVLAPSAHSFEPNTPFDVDMNSFEEFSQIIADMTGEDLGTTASRPTPEPPEVLGEFDFDCIFIRS